MAIVICDTSSLIKLSIAETLCFLPELFRTIVIPKAVYQECPANLRSQIDNFGFSLETPKTCVFAQFGAGEREALNLAVEKPWAGAFVLTDDRKAINAAARTGIKTITAFDFFAALKLTNRIDDTRPLVQKLRNAGEGISEAELRRMREQTGEQYSEEESPRRSQ
jgi:predicted nucleic acid-binding protein